MRKLPKRGRVIGVAIVLTLAAVLALVLWPGRSQRHVTAYFTQAIGLYPGDSVRALGVKVGTVDKVTPQGGRVRIEMSYDSADPLPVGAKAAIIAPTLVSGRYVQISPAYTSGPQMLDNATIPLSRTAIPVEWDEIEKQVNQLTTALGPQGANKNGALSNLLNTTAANLSGKGGNIHDTIQQLSRAVTALSEGRGDLFATIDNLQKFVAALADNDAQVGQFVRQLSAVSGVLSTNRQNLAATLSTLDQSLGIITKFINDNRAALGNTLKDLNTTTANLASKRQELADVLQVAPNAVGDFQNIYDPLASALTGEVSLANLRSPAVFMCSTLFSLGGTPKACQQAIAPLAQLVKTDQVPVKVNAIDRNGRSNQATPDQLDRSGTGGSPPSAQPGGGLFGLLLPGGGR